MSSSAGALVAPKWILTLIVWCLPIACPDRLGGQVKTGSELNAPVPATANRPDDLGEAEYWIERLDSSRYALRNEATEQLASLGEKAIEPLRQVIVDGGQESRSRAFRVLRRIAEQQSMGTCLAVESTLSELADHPSHLIAKTAEAKLEKLVPVIESAIGSYLEDLGARIARTGFPINRGAGFRNAAIRSITIGEQWQGTRDDLMYLRRCQSITSLEIISGQVDEGILSSIAQMEDLINLELEGAGLNNESLKHLRDLPRLRTLSLRYVEIDDGAVSTLTQLQQLNRLTLIGTRISEDGRERLSNKFPGTRLDYRRGGFFGVRYNVGTGPCVLTEVIEGTGAARAGLEVGDRIIRFGEDEVEVGEDFRKAVSKYYVGDTVEVELIRDGEKKTLQATLGRWKM